MAGRLIWPENTSWDKIGELQKKYRLTDTDFAWRVGEVVSGQWFSGSVGSGKWEVGSGKWEVGRIGVLRGLGMSFRSRQDGSACTPAAPV
jgi:hypothetical protein